MAQKKKYRFFNSKLTSAVSISMVLFLLGCTISVSMVARNMSKSILEKIALTVYMRESASPEQIQSFSNFVSSQPYTKEATFISKEQAINEVCVEMGEDPEEFADQNPLPNTFVVHVQAQYANNDSVIAISQRIGELDCVDRVGYQKNMIHTIVRNVNRIAFALFCATMLLLFISYVLIHNTIELLVHSDRFLIHTMKLVGATGWFIRKPYLKQGFVIALVAFGLASAYLLGLNHFFRNDFPFSIIEMEKPEVFVPLFGSMLVCSVLVTSIATVFAVGKYLKKKSDDLYYI